jgi:hypothetical protein
MGRGGGHLEKSKSASHSIEVVVSIFGGDGARRRAAVAMDRSLGRRSTRSLAGGWRETQAARVLADELQHEDDLLSECAGCREGNRVRGGRVTSVGSGLFPGAGFATRLKRVHRPWCFHADGLL